MSRVLWVVPCLLFRRVPAPVVASPLESHASYSRLTHMLPLFVHSFRLRGGNRRDTTEPAAVRWVPLCPCSSVTFGSESQCLRFTFASRGRSVRVSPCRISAA